MGHIMQDMARSSIKNVWRMIMKLKRLFAVATSVIMAGTLLFTVAACKKDPKEEVPEGDPSGLVFKANYVGETTYEDGGSNYEGGMFGNSEVEEDEDEYSLTAFAVPVADEEDEFGGYEEDDRFGYGGSEEEEDDSNKVIESYFVSSVGTNTEPHLTIPSTYNGYPVVAIGVDAFANHDKLRTLRIPSSVKRIARAAFRGCTALSTVTFEEGCEYIGDFAFADCEQLREVKLPYSLRVLDNGAFMNCSFMQKFELPEGLQQISANAFSGCTDLIEINVPFSVKTLSVECFYGCTSLREFSFHSDVTSIPDRYLMACTQLRDIYFDGTVEEWDAMSKGQYWDYNKGGSKKRSYTVHFADGSEKNY